MPVIELAGIVRDQYAAIGQGDGGDLNVVRADHLAPLLQRSSNRHEMIGGCIVVGQAGNRCKQKIECGTICRRLDAFRTTITKFGDDDRANPDDCEVRCSVSHRHRRGTPAEQRHPIIGTADPRQHSGVESFASSEFPLLAGDGSHGRSHHGKINYE